MMYAEPAILARAAAEVAGRGKALPFFRDPIILDRGLAWDFLRLHVALEGAAPRLEQDARLLATLTRLVARHAGVRPRRLPVGSTGPSGWRGSTWRTTSVGASRWKSSRAWRT
jgi:hypothetical protein